MHQSGDHHRQAGRRPGNLEWRTCQQPGDDTANHSANESGDDRCPRSKRDAQRKRHSDKEDNKGGGEIATQEIHFPQQLLRNHDYANSLLKGFWTTCRRERQHTQVSGCHSGHPAFIHIDVVRNGLDVISMGQSCIGLSFV